jgi:hypothetical protein
VDGTSLQERHSVCEILVPQIYLPGDLIIKGGSLVDELFFITKGEVQVLSLQELSVTQHKASRRVECHTALPALGC